MKSIWKRQKTESNINVSVNAIPIQDCTTERYCQSSEEILLTCPRKYCNTNTANTATVKYCQRSGEIFQLQKAYFPRSKFHAPFLTLRFPSFSSFLIPPLKGLFLLFLISSSNTKKGRFLLGFSSLNSLKRWFLSILTSFTHLNLWKAGFTWVAELPEEKDKHLRSNIQSRRQLQLQLSTCRWFNFPSLDCHYFQYLPSILNFNIDNIHDISITWK